MTRFVDTPRLRVGYEEWNAGAPRSVLLLHGWPDSVRCWAQVAPVLAAAGWHVLAPALRGCAPTTFRDAATPRSGQLAALGRDVLDIVDALQLQRPALVGHDWGARAAGNACGLRPGVASHLAMLSVGYGTNVASQVLPLEQARLYWYHWYMATAHGERSLRADRRAFCRYMWDTWAPAGWYDPQEFERTAAAFEGEDWIDVVLHSYRHRWGHAEGDPHYAADEAALQPAPVLDVPTLVLHGAADGVNPPASSQGKERYFRRRYERRLLEGVGHFPQREAPAEVAAALVAFLQA